jgi:hypothetical protein
MARWRIENKNPSDEMRKQREREMEVIRLQRQQALEEEEIRQVSRRRYDRSVEGDMAGDTTEQQEIRQVSRRRYGRRYDRATGDTTGQ